MDIPIEEPMSRRDAAINAERLANEAHHATKEGDRELAKLIYLEAQVYATLATRPFA